MTPRMARAVPTPPTEVLAKDVSQYVKYNCRALRNRELLLQALANMGWHGERIEVHATPQTLLDWHGMQRPEKAEIIIRRKHTGVGMSNDIGFVFNEATKCFDAIVSDYDRNAVLPQFDGERMPFTEAVEKSYGRVAADKTISTLLTTTIPHLKATGKIPLRATVDRQESAQAIRLVVRV